MKSKLLVITLLGIVILSGCSQLGMDTGSDSQSNRPGMMSHNMGARHHTQVPEEFAGLTNPIPADDGSLARGAEIYAAQCATCHGDFGNGDGPGGTALDPAPAPIAHTGQMMSDAYLFWRITEGGATFETGMIPYKDILDEDARWDVINFVRALGRGEAHPIGPKVGGIPFNPSQEQAQRAEMLSQAVADDVITQAEADVFDTVHSTMDVYLSSESASGLNTGSRGDALPQILQAMVAADLISKEQADVLTMCMIA